MKKNIYILIFVLANLHIKGQSDRIKTNKNTIQLLGIGAGYRNYYSKNFPSELNSIMKYYGEININYIANRAKYLYVKAQIDIAPTQKFNLIINATTCMGFTTNMKKKISWHLALGIGVGGNSKKYLKTISLPYAPFQYEETYSISLIGAHVETGFYFKPFKSETKYIGINVSLSQYSVSSNSYKYSVNEILPYFSISYNHLLYNKNKLK